MNKNLTEDLFNFRDYVLFLKNKLDTTDLSQVVGVHGDYGAGKTTTMNIIQDLYKEDELGYNNILEFSAWRNYYNKEDTVWKALLYELAGKIYDLFDSKYIKEKINIEQINVEGINLKDNSELKKTLNINLDSIVKKIKLLSKGYDLEAEETFINTTINYFKNIKSILKKDNDINITLDKIKKELISIYIKNTCLEIQYNLYQDLKDFDGELKKGKTEAEKYPFLSILQCISGLINVLKDGSIGNNITDLGELLKQEEQDLKKIRIDSLEVIQRKFDILINFYNSISGIKPLIIMIDDLDRILPEKSVEIIEILRIFFEKSQKIHFICSIDIRVIEKGIERKFNQLNKGGDISRIEFEEYLEKIITIPFDLPAIPFGNVGGINSISVLITNNNENKDETKKYNENEIIKIIKDKNIVNDVYKNKVFLNIVITGLQSNPRKIKRFKEIFNIYFSILIYRILKYNGDILDNNNYIKDINKFSYLLAKLLIIKLEWDEVYKEISKDKLFLAFLEDLAMKINGDIGDNFNISSKISLITKNTKNYKIGNLYGMLGINEEESIFNDDDIIKTYKNLYIVYYLIPDNKNINLEVIQKNENIENITNANLLKYLYSDEPNKIIFYIKHYKKLLQEIEINNSSPDSKDKVENIINKYINQLQYYKVFLESNI